MNKGRRSFLKALGATTGAIGLAGVVNAQQSDLNFIVSVKYMGQGGLFAQAKAADWYTQDMDGVNVQIVNGQSSATTQNQRTIQAMSQDTDGILLNPYDAKASTQIVSEAKSMDIPVFNFDTATLSKDVVIGILFGQYRGGEVVAQRFKEEILPDMPENPNILNAVFSFESTTSQQRLNGFQDNVPDSVNFVDTVVSTGTASEAATPILNAIRGADETIHGIYSNNVGSAMGALTALQQLGRYAPKDSPDHVPAFGIDGGSTLNQRIAEGYYDFAVDQPLHFYAPLTLELLFTHLGVDPPNSGTHPDELPTADDEEVTTEDLKPANKTVFGIQPWKENFWAPAQMTTYQANDTEWWPWVKAGHAMITQDNADAPYLYGNVLREFNQQEG